MPEDNDTLQMQQQQQQEIQIQQQEQAEQQEQAQAEQQEQAEVLELPQPAEVEAAPVPVMEEPVQQQNMTYKERRAARAQARREAKAAQKAQRQRERERQRQEREQERQRQQQERERQRQEAAALEAKKNEARAVAKMLADRQPILNQMKGDPAYALAYEASAPTVPLLNELEALEEYFLEQCRASNYTEHETRNILNKIRPLRSSATAYDQRRQEHSFAENYMGEYMRAHNLKLPKGTAAAFPAYARQLNDSGQLLGVQIAALRESLFPGLTTEEIIQRLEPVKQIRKGNALPAYQQAYAAQIQTGQMTISQAKIAYEEDLFRQRRPVTLKNFPDQRYIHRNDRSFQKTLKDYDFIRQTNQLLQEEEVQGPRQTYQTADELTREYLEDAIRNASFQLRVPNCEIMGLILDSGRFKTQMETNSSKALLDLTTRKQFAGRCFGINPETLPPEQFEVYGYASDGDLVRESRPDSKINRGACQYGHIVVTLRKERMKERTTFTLGDSLSNQFATRMSYVHSPDLQAVGALFRPEVVKAAYLHHKAKQEEPNAPCDVEQLLDACDCPYAELQYHGGVRLEDIESVTLLADAFSEEAPEAIEQEMPAELVERLRALGIKAYKVKDGEQNEL